MRKEEIKTICPGTTAQDLNKGSLLVDVREKAEREALSFALSDSVHLPLSELETRYRELPLDRPLIVACQSGTRSLRAAAYLMHRGYSEVANLEGGILAWRSKGYPVEGEGAALSDCCASDNCC